MSTIFKILYGTHASQFGVLRIPDNLKNKPLVIIGHSSGGHLALWLASLVNKLKSNDLTNELMVPI